MSRQRQFARHVEEPPFGWTDVFREYVDMHELRDRGWTRRMVRVLLGQEDNRGPVDHWLNFAGKLLFLRTRVAAAEATPQFRLLFRQSLRGRTFSEVEIHAVLHRSQMFEQLIAAESLPGGPPMTADQIARCPEGPATDVNYAIDSAALITTSSTASLWLGFQWQPTTGQWMAHLGKKHRFFLITPKHLKRLIREARSKDLVVASYHAEPPKLPPL